MAQESTYAPSRMAVIDHKTTVVGPRRTGAA
jgi:hypothetical protein